MAKAAGLNNGVVIMTSDEEQLCVSMPRVHFTSWCLRPPLSSTFCCSCFASSDLHPIMILLINSLAISYLRALQTVDVSFAVIMAACLARSLGTGSLGQ